jgi:hypothetical protein
MQIHIEEVLGNLPLEVLRGNGMLEVRQQGKKHHVKFNFHPL